MSWIAPQTQILLLGAGELGTAFLPHLAALPHVHITLGIRTISKYTHLADLNVSLRVLDLSGPSEQLSETFSRFDVVISCTGFGQSAGTVTKLANEMLEAGKLRKTEEKGKLWFFPWQWGVDYDITGDGQGMMPLFGEQVGVRTLLREKAAESNVKWTIVSTGIFMSFLFEQYWGVIDREGDKIIVRALGSWNHGVSVTDVGDIGKILARIVAGDVESENRVLYVAGDSVKYEQLAHVLERVAGVEVEREEWTTSHLEEELEKDPENLIKRYRLVFANDGVYWDMTKTVNYQLDVPVTDLETYARGIMAKRVKKEETE